MRSTDRPTTHSSPSWNRNQTSPSDRIQQHRGFASLGSSRRKTPSRRGDLYSAAIQEPRLQPTSRAFSCPLLLQRDNRGLFKALSHAIQQHFINGVEPHPAERTLLTTGTVEAVKQLFGRQGEPVPTPHLESACHAQPWNRFRESGRTWEIITTETPQPATFQPRSFTELHLRP